MLTQRYTANLAQVNSTYVDTNTNSDLSLPLLKFAITVLTKRWVVVLSSSQSIFTKSSQFIAQSLISLFQKQTTFIIFFFLSFCYSRGLLVFQVLLSAFYRSILSIHFFIVILLLSFGIWLSSHQTEVLNISSHTELQYDLLSLHYLRNCLLSLSFFLSQSLNTIKACVFASDCNLYKISCMLEKERNFFTYFLWIQVLHYGHLACCWFYLNSFPSRQLKHTWCWDMQIIAGSFSFYPQCSKQREHQKPLTKLDTALSIIFSIVYLQTKMKIDFIKKQKGQYEYFMKIHNKNKQKQVL